MIAVVDYGVGNLRSVAKALEKVGAEVRVTARPQEIAAARGIVLPGVGAFGACLDNLRRTGLEEPVRSAFSSGKPFLAICVGMQILFEESEEFGPVAGLGLLPGRVARFPRAADLEVPHMGWNRLRIQRSSALLHGIEDGSFAYFVHSYYVLPADPDLVTTVTDYGLAFSSSVASGNVFGCQFHPEKSQTVGLRMLANFRRLVEESSGHHRGH